MFNDEITQMVKKVTRFLESDELTDTENIFCTMGKKYDTFERTFVYMDREQVQLEIQQHPMIIFISSPDIYVSLNVKSEYFNTLSNAMDKYFKKEVEL